MSERTSLSAITEDEKLARYILVRSQIRQNGQTVKPDAFIPHPHSDLSVTRHLELDESALWRIGQEIADERMPPVTLHGRADINVMTVTQQKLQTQPDPTINNPNHAIIVGWPNDKPAQKTIAQQLAAEAQYKAKPDMP